LLKNNNLRLLLKIVLIIVVVSSSLSTFSQEQSIKKKIDSIVLRINSSELFLRRSFTPDSTYYTTYFKEEYYVDSNNKIAKVINEQRGNLAKIMSYYFLNDKLIEVTSEILNADSALYKKNYYFDNGKPLKVTKKDRNSISYFIGKAENILETIYKD